MNDIDPISFFYNELYELNEFFKWLSKRPSQQFVKFLKCQASPFGMPSAYNSYNLYNSLWKNNKGAVLCILTQPLFRIYIYI